MVQSVRHALYRRSLQLTPMIPMLVYPCVSCTNHEASPSRSIRDGVAIWTLALLEKKDVSLPPRPADFALTPYINHDIDIGFACCTDNQKRSVHI